MEPTLDGAQDFLHCDLISATILVCHQTFLQ